MTLSQNLKISLKAKKLICPEYSQNDGVHDVKNSNWLKNWPVTVRIYGDKENFKYDEEETDNSVKAKILDIYDLINKVEGDYLKAFKLVERSWPSVEREAAANLGNCNLMRELEPAHHHHYHQQHHHRRRFKGLQPYAGTWTNPTPPPSSTTSSNLEVRNYL